MRERNVIGRKWERVWSKPQTCFGIIARGRQLDRGNHTPKFARLVVETMGNDLVAKRVELATNAVSKVTGFEITQSGKMHRRTVRPKRTRIRRKRMRDEIENYEELK